jgi:hypothetical protein
MMYENFYALGDLKLFFLSTFEFRKDIDFLHLFGHEEMKKMVREI